MLDASSGLLWVSLLLAALLAWITVRRRPRTASTCPQGPEAQPHAAERFGNPARALGLALAFWLAIFLPLVTFARDGFPSALPTEQVPAWQFFWLHAIFGATFVLWWLTRSPAGEEVALELGLRTRDGEQFAPGSVPRELAVGVVSGLVAWAVVMAILLLLAALATQLVGERWMPESMPAPSQVLAAVPLGLRIAVALSAGFFEELFFRGLLQTRLGVLASTVLFVGAHAAYGQPLVWIGIAILSLMFAALRRWRGSIWAAVAAHATFDLVQLLFVLPTATA